MLYCRHIMVNTRAFIWAISRTVIAKPSLLPPAIKLALSSRARNRKGMLRYLPSMKYLAFRIETQYGKSHVDSEQLRNDLVHYLNWTKNYADKIS